MNKMKSFLMKNKLFGRSLMQVLYLVGHIFLSMVSRTILCILVLAISMSSFGVFPNESVMMGFLTCLWWMLGLGVGHICTEFKYLKGRFVRFEQKEETKPLDSSEESENV